MPQLIRDPALPYANQLYVGARHRPLATALTLVITGLFLLMLLSVGLGSQPEKKEVAVSVVSLEAREPAEDASQAAAPKGERADTPSTSPHPATDTPALPRPTQQTSAPVLQPRAEPMPPTPDEWTPSPTTSPIGVRAPDGRNYGPPNKGGSPAGRDTERVGTAPNGAPLYAAAWYREPSNDELRGYLSTASGPGWGLIACRTAPDYRVEDCVGLDEYPNGSQLNRAILAAAWQFRVRPPRVGGKTMVGEWVRIRIDYSVQRR